MGKRGIRQKKSRMLTLLLAFLLPGAGHIYVGQFPRGLLLLVGLLLDFTAIVHLAESDGGRHLLLIVYLTIMLPVFYFISVYDALHFVEQQPEGPVLIGVGHGFLLILGGLLLLLLNDPPDVLLPWMNELAVLSVGPIIILIAVTLAVRSREGAVFVFKLGRLTSAALISAVGVLLLRDLLKERNDITLIGQWWPVIILLLGIEIIVFSVVLRHRAKKLRFDMKGSIIALVITVTAYGVTQYSDFPARWLDQFNVDLNGVVDYGEENGFRYDKTVMKLPLDRELSSIQIVNSNGNVIIRSGDVQEIELRTIVWVDMEEESGADTVAEQSIVKVTPGAETVFEAKGQSFGSSGSRLPRMNMEIIVPLSLSDQVTTPGMPSSDEAIPPLESEEELISPKLGDESEEELISSELGDESGAELEAPVGDAESESSLPGQTLVRLQIDLDFGSIEVSNLTMLDGIVLKNSNGLVSVSNVNGAVDIKGNNGNIIASFINGDSSLETKNGSIAAKSITGNLYANILNGNLEIEQIDGDIDAETKNGKVNIDEAAAALKANTLNGSIEVSSTVVGGQWDLDSSVGEISLSIPDSGHYSLYGSVTFGNIATELPFDINRKTIRGVIGEGTFRISINATNSISIKRK